VAVATRTHTHPHTPTVTGYFMKRMTGMCFMCVCVCVECACLLVFMAGDCEQDAEAAMWAGCKAQVHPVLRTSISNGMEAELARRANLLPIDGEQPKARSKIASHWWDYLAWLHDIQETFAAHETKAFSILPLCSLELPHVTVDAVILYGLLRRMEAANLCGRELIGNGNLREKDRCKLFTCAANSSGNLSRFFMPAPRHRHNMGRTVQTDGYAVTMHMELPKRNPAPLPKATAEDLNGKRVIGVDPGRRDLVTCSWEDEDGNEHTTHFSNREYQARIGAKKAGGKRRQWMEKKSMDDGQTLLDVLCNLPSGKAHSSDGLREHITAILRVLPTILEENARRRVRYVHHGVSG
jgi:hypothetical protein